MPTNTKYLDLQSKSIQIRLDHFLRFSNDLLIFYRPKIEKRRGTKREKPSVPITNLWINFAPVRDRIRDLSLTRPTC